jgi:hypothetical protein
VASVAAHLSVLDSGTGPHPMASFAMALQASTELSWSTTAAVRVVLIVYDFPSDTDLNDRQVCLCDFFVYLFVYLFGLHFVFNFMIITFAFHSSI